MLLLAFTAVDLASHGECDEDWLGIPAAALRLAAAADRGAPAPELRAATEQSDSTGGAESPEEDCFCCCSHLLVTPQYVFPSADVASTKLAMSRPNLPTSPPSSLDRPPRTV